METVRVRFTKWGDHPHWMFGAHPFGDDAHGLWFGLSTGTRMSRPGLDVQTTYESVLLVPRDRPYIALFMARPATPGDQNPPQVYVDVTTVPVIDSNVITAVDLDLDVVRLLDGTTFVEDEDEFVVHRERYGYPADVIELAETAVVRLAADVRHRVEPFGAVSDGWLGTWMQRLPSLGAAPPPAP